MHLYFTGPIQVVLRVIDNSFGISGRKRLFYLFLCLLGTLASFIVIRSWIYVPTYTHMIYVDHPFSSDTSSYHFVTADVEVMMYDGYLVYGNKDEKHKMTRSCIFHYENRLKDPSIKKPFYPTVDGVNNYAGDNVVSNTGDDRSLALSEMGNMGVFCHTFNTGSENLLTNSPYTVDHTYKVDAYGKQHKVILAHAFNDDNVLRSPAYNYLKQRLPSFFYDERSGHFIHSYACIVSDKTDSITIIGHSADEDPVTFWDKVCYHSRQFIKLHDISRCCYNVYVATSGVDSINVRISFYEDADIVSGHKKAGKNYVESTSKGDSDSMKGVSVFSFNATLLESENTQLVRLFFITTFCAGFLGLFLKYLVQILLSTKFRRKQ